MDRIETYDTVSQAVEGLRKQGYTEDFNIAGNCLECAAREIKLLHDEFKVDKLFRFEGMTDPGDEAAVYAISSHKHDHKGILVSAYGIYADEVTEELVKALYIDPNK